jgi:hypothetical protein
MRRKRPRRPTAANRILRLLIILVASCAAFVALSIGYFSMSRASDFSAQRRRVAALRSAPPARAGSLAADLALPDETPFSSLRYLATHNSYRRSSDSLRLLYIGLVEPLWPEKLAYSHPALTEQLDSGIRSLELDVRARKGGFVLAHVPLVDDRTDEPDFALALEELAIWSGRNPGHVPLVVILELKDDYSFLDPALRKWDAAALDRLDAALRSGLGSKLLPPDELRGGKPTLAGALLERGWPKLGAMRGRIIVVLHQDEALRRLYTEGRTGLEGRPVLFGRAMLDCAPAGSPDEAVAILNEAIGDGAEIAARSAKGVLVRTRADADLVHSPELLAAALASGARIVSTDFPPGRPAPDGYVAALPGGRFLDVPGSAEAAPAH